LYRFSLDHLSWLYNILEGEMSFVGPIPRRVGSFHTTIDPTDKIFKFKPGFTGLWQVSRPYSADPIRSDLEYIENWSLSLDAKIMFKTIWVALSNK
jgi:lipopolysaccharide/colanic/teichoic acid biosynthesis glycosyltransferase